MFGQELSTLAAERRESAEWEDEHRYDHDEIDPPEEDE